METQYTMCDELNPSRFHNGKGIFFVTCYSPTYPAENQGCGYSALISYNMIDSNWFFIKECLSLHYAYKRDIRTLVHQLYLNQKGMKIYKFYTKVNHQFPLSLTRLNLSRIRKRRWGLGYLLSGPQRRHFQDFTYTTSRNLIRSILCISKS